MKFPLKTLLLVWLMFVAIQASAQTTSATPQTSQKVEDEIVINKKPLKDFGEMVLELKKNDKLNSNSQTIEKRNYQNEIIINKMPIRDFGRYVVEKLKKDEVDLNAPFVVEFESVLGKEGKLDSKLSKFTKTEGDEKLVEIVKYAIAAVNDSGYLQYLQQIGGKKGFVSIQQDKDNFSVSIKSELVSDTEAKKLATGFNSVLQIAKYRKQRIGADENDKDELRLLEFALVKSEGKFLMLNFVMPQTVKQELINRKLNELKTERYY